MLYLTRIKEMNRVGVEPTTSAHKQLFLRKTPVEIELYCSTPTRSILNLRLRNSSSSALGEIILNFDTSFSLSWLPFD
jgi:hypothetical protein